MYIAKNICVHLDKKENISLKSIIKKLCVLFLQFSFNGSLSSLGEQRIKDFTFTNDENSFNKISHSRALRDNLYH